MLRETVNKAVHTFGTCRKSGEIERKVGKKSVVLIVWNTIRFGR